VESTFGGEAGSSVAGEEGKIGSPVADGEVESTFGEEAGSSVASEEGEIGSPVADGEVELLLGGETGSSVAGGGVASSAIAVIVKTKDRIREIFTAIINNFTFRWLSIRSPIINELY
jgi:hypothetical protein